MTTESFVYPTNLLDECAASNLVASLAVKDSSIQNPLSPYFSIHGSKEDLDHIKYDQSCAELWKLYILHYEKSLEYAEFFEKSFERSTWQDANGRQVRFYKIRPRVEQFLQSVAFVQEHNNDPDVSHRVSLNRFSILDTEHIFSEVDFEDIRRRAIEVESPNVGIGHGAKNILYRHHSSHYTSSQDVPVKEIRIPDAYRKPFQTPVIGADLDGFLLSIKKRHHLAQVGPGEDAVNSADFDEYLNWATNENPDGVGIVRDAFDQLSCGSCWAFAAAGSLEASASRRAAFIAYETFRTSHRNRQNMNETVEEKAVAVARRVQRRAMHVLNLSVQELLDCDSTTDQGCVGGNPLLAFYYIHQNGLVSWKDYPYRAEAGTCQMNATQDPVATVKSWGIIQSDHENHMQLALRYIGPIAVGINGDNAEFLSYSDGIFDSPKCKQKANHALLVVGYGEEENPQGELVKYWIARNSWGTGWGENGYVRIKRGAGHFGIPGVCGIARNPSVALGGVLLRDTAYVFNESGLNERSSNPQVEHVCTHLGFNASRANTCIRTAEWVDSHKAFTLGLIGVLCGLILLWPLSIDARRRRHFRRLQKVRREERRRNSSRQMIPTEDTPLLPSTTTETVTNAS